MPVLVFDDEGQLGETQVLDETAGFWMTGRGTFSKADLNACSDPMCKVVAVQYRLAVGGRKVGVRCDGD